jgi:hypothetical protein
MQARMTSDTPRACGVRHAHDTAASNPKNYSGMLAAASTHIHRERERPAGCVPNSGRADSHTASAACGTLQWPRWPLPSGSHRGCTPQDTRAQGPKSALLPAQPGARRGRGSLLGRAVAGRPSRGASRTWSWRPRSAARVRAASAWLPSQAAAASWPPPWPQAASLWLRVSETQRQIQDKMRVSSCCAVRRRCGVRGEGGGAGDMVWRMRRS